MLLRMLPPVIGVSVEKGGLAATTTMAMAARNEKEAATAELPINAAHLFHSVFHEQRGAASTGAWPCEVTAAHHGGCVESRALL